MHDRFKIAAALALLLTATPAFAQQNQQQQNDQTAKEVHDQVKDGLNSIGGAENQGPPPTTGSYLPDTNSAKDEFHSAVQGSANLFDSATGAASEAIR